MNRIERRVACESIEMQREVDRIEQGQSDARIFQLYQELRTNPQVRWKESIKEVVGLAQVSEPGLDV